MGTEAAMQRTGPAPGASPRTDHRERIAASLQRLRETVRSRPTVGRRTARSVVTLGDGLRCVSTVQSWDVACDLPPALGGERTAPTPSQLVQAALGACLAMCYQLRAAELGVELASVTVTVESDSDVSGLLNLRSGSAGFAGLRYHVDIASPADAATVVALVDSADRRSPVLADLTRPLSIERTVSVSSPSCSVGR